MPELERAQRLDRDDSVRGLHVVRQDERPRAAARPRCEVRDRGSRSVGDELEDEVGEIVDAALERPAWERRARLPAAVRAAGEDLQRAGQQWPHGVIGAARALLPRRRPEV